MGFGAKKSLFLLAEFHPIGKGKICVFNFCLALIMMIDNYYDVFVTDDNDNQPWWF